MSRESGLRGITCPDMTRVVREALSSGWEWVGFTGTTHAQIVWPDTGKVLRFGTTPGVASWKSLARDIERESGVTVWRKGNRKRSRKNFAAPDQQVEAARRRHAQQHQERLEREHAEREAARSEEQRRMRAAQRAAADDRRRREIEELMR